MKSAKCKKYKGFVKSHEGNNFLQIDIFTPWTNGKDSHADIHRNTFLSSTKDLLPSKLDSVTKAQFI